MTLSAAFRQQAESCRALGSPFMGQLLDLLAEHGVSAPLRTRFAAFDGDIGPAGASLPLRLAGGLRALVLSGRSPALAAHYPPHTATDPDLWHAVAAAMAEHEGFLLAWVDSPPQTNEVRRSAALMAGAAVAAARFDLPVWLSELGASGGLNLHWDKFHLALPGGSLGPPDADVCLTPTWEGPLPPSHVPTVAARGGVDLSPLDPTAPDDLMRLMAFLWPDQPERLALTKAAAKVQSTRVEKGDAIDWLQRRLEAAPAGHLHLIQHTVAWQYFPPEAQARGTQLIEATGRDATPERPLAWLAMESDGDRKGTRGARLTLRLWPGDLHLDLARVDFHGRWVIWHDQKQQGG